MKKRTFTIPIIFFIITFVLLVLPGNEFPKTKFFLIKGLDKLVHTFMFFVLTWLFYRPFKTMKMSVNEKQKWFFVIAVSAIVYGTLMEFVQLFFVANRSFEMADILVDALGAMLAFIIGRKRMMEAG